MTEDFSTTAQLVVEVDQQSLSQAKQTIESEIGSTEVGVADGSAPSAQMATDGGAAAGLSPQREAQFARREHRWARQRTEHLEDILEVLEGLDVDEGGGGLLGAGGMVGGLLDTGGDLFGAGALVGAAGALTGAATALTGAAVALGGSSVIDTVSDLVSGEDGIDIDIDALEELEEADGQLAIGVDYPEDGVPLDYPADGIPIDEDDDSWLDPLFDADPFTEPPEWMLDSPFDPSPPGWLLDPPWPFSSGDSLSVDDPSPLDVVDDPIPLDYPEEGVPVQAAGTGDIIIDQNAVTKGMQVAADVDSLEDSPPTLTDPDFTHFTGPFPDPFGGIGRHLQEGREAFGEIDFDPLRTSSVGPVPVLDPFGGFSDTTDEPRVDPDDPFITPDRMLEQSPSERRGSTGIEQTITIDQSVENTIENVEVQSEVAGFDDLRRDLVREVDSEMRAIERDLQSEIEELRRALDSTR